MYLDALPDVAALVVVVLVAEALPPVAKVGGDHEDVGGVGEVAREDPTVLYLQNGTEIDQGCQSTCG